MKKRGKRKPTLQSADKDGTSKTPANLDIYEASKLGRLEDVQTLIASGVRVDGLNESGESALMLASQNGHAEVAKWLALAGVNLEVKDGKMDTTALMFACIGGHYATVRELLIAGANVDVMFDSENNAVTPLMFATQYTGLMKLQGQPWAYFGAVVRVLLDGGASVHLTDKKGRTALMFAAELGHVEVTGWLIASGSDVEAADINGTRPLMYASIGAHMQVVMALLEAGADPNTTNSKGSGSLHFAASGGSLPIMNLLLKKDCDVDAANVDGDNALSLAISAGKVGAVGYLIEKANASLECIDKEGRSCLDLAAVMFSLFPEQGRQVILEFLKGKGATFKMIDADFIEASHKRAKEIGVRVTPDIEKVLTSSAALPSVEEEQGGGSGLGDSTIPTDKHNLREEGLQEAHVMEQVEECGDKGNDLNC